MSCTTRGLPCRLGCPRRGGLLLHHFTLACALAGHRRYAFCCTFRPAVSRLPSLAFTRHVALWCPDFPQPCLHMPATVQGAAHQVSSDSPRLPRKTLQGIFLRGSLALGVSRCSAPSQLFGPIRRAGKHRAMGIPAGAARAPAITNVLALGQNFDLASGSLESWV